MMANTEITNPQNVEQFNLLNEQIFHDNLVGKLTNWRPLGNKHTKVRNTVLSGYYKHLLLIDKMLVKAKASKQLTIS
jgi:hypothetical protein